MHTEDLILVSVDGPRVETDRHVRRNGYGQMEGPRPRSFPKDTGIDVGPTRERDPNVGLNAVVGRPPEEYGIEPSPSPRCGARLLPDINERIRDMNVNGVLGS